MNQLRWAKEAGELPQVYLNHPAVTSAPAGVDVHPVALYLDGVAYHRLDSVLGIWVYFLLTGHRHLIVVSRRSELCSCGRKGWDSLCPVFYHDCLEPIGHDSWRTPPPKA